MDSLHPHLLLLLCCVVFASAIVHYDPEQVHIATGSYDEMIVVWNTGDDTNDSTVLYGKTRGFDLTANGSSVKFVDGGSEHKVQYVHTVTLTGLEPETQYYYMVGSKLYGFSDVFSFTTWPIGDNWVPRLAVYGDLGNANPQSLTRLEVEAAKGFYHAILHVGDFAYDMDTDNGRVGDAFMRQIQPLATSVPYLTSPGNHEHAYNFSEYKNRFRNPGDIDQRMYYSFKMGPVRFISTSTEYIFYPQWGILPTFRHYIWLEEQLRDANLPENRAKQPWIITLGHRPMYCSNSDNDDCSHNESIIRTGLYNYLGWEKLFQKYGVDVALWAHEHSYERLWPIYNRQVLNGSTEAPYTNPKAPVHIITGSAGCKWKHDPFNKTQPYWSAFRSYDYGYTRLKAFNSSHLYMEQVSDDKGGAVIDKVMVIKDKHGPYEYDPRPIMPVGDFSELKKKWDHHLKTNGINLP